MTRRTCYFHHFLVPWIIIHLLLLHHYQTTASIALSDVPPYKEVPRDFLKCQTMSDPRVVNSSWAPCISSSRDDGDDDEVGISEINVGDKVRCTQRLKDGGFISSHCLSVSRACALEVRPPTRQGKLSCDIKPNLCKKFINVVGWKWRGKEDISVQLPAASASAASDLIISGEENVTIHCLGVDNQGTYLESPAFRLGEQRGESSSEGSPIFGLMKAVENDSVTIPCHGLLDQLEESQVLWFLSKEKDVIEAATDTMRINDDGSLRIPTVNRQKHEGSWWCQRRHRGRQETVSRVQLVVLHPPTQKMEAATEAIVKIVPEHSVVGRGESVKFICHISKGGVSEDVEIEWLQNGRQIETDKKVLILHNVTASIHGGWYQCIVWKGSNVLGNAMARLAIVADKRRERYRRETKRKPYFISVSPDQRISAGGSAKLKCIAGGNPLPRLAWILNGKVLPYSMSVDAHRNNSRIDFHLEDAQSSLHSGLYSCRADNVFGEVQTSVRIDVDGPPFIREMTSPHRRMLAGSRMEWLNCPYGGYPIDAITWDKEGQRLPLDERQIVWANGTLLLKNISQADGGAYTCSAWQGSRNATSQPVEVQVEVPPRIEPFSFPSKLQEGWRARVTCSAPIGDLPIRFEWLFNGEKLKGDVSLVVSPDAFSSSLSFSSLRTSHSGNYTCKASNAASSDKYSAHLLVNVAPKWLTIPEDARVRRGSTLLIKCQASGVPHPKIVWKRAVKNANKPAPLFMTVPFSKDAHFQSEEEGDLMIVNANESHEGQYLCQAHNGVGSAKSKLISIKVEVPPVFTMESFTQTANVNDEGTPIKCVVIGDRPLHISWKRNGLDIGPPSFRVEEQELPRGLQSILRLNGRAQRQDTATFQCIASNQFGVNKTSINFVVQEVPDTPENFLMVSHSSREANLSWSLPFDGRSPLLAFYLEFHRPLNAGYKQEDLLRLVKAPGNATSWQIGDLRPNTAYAVSISAINGVGASRPSRQLNFRTNPEPPEGPVTQIEASSNSSHSIIVSWKPPHPDLQHGAIISYSIGYRMANASLEDPFRYVTIDARNPQTRLEREIEQLKTFTDYHVVVQAFNRMGAGPKSPEVIVTTMEDVPSSPPEHVQCFPVSSRSLYITWRPPPPQDRNGILVEYGVFYRPLILWQEKAHTLEARTLQEKITLEGLRCHQNYSIHIVAATKMGDGFKSKSIYCRTKEDLPEPPQNIKALPLDRNSIMISWLPPKEPNGDILGYSLYMKTMEKGRQFTQDFSLGAHINYYTMSGLHQGQPYSFWVSAYTLAGEGRVSEIVGETPQVSIPAGIASFSQKVIHALKETVEMKCVTVGIPAPSLQWTKNGIAISVPDFVSRRLRLEDNGSKLRLEKVEMADAANYSCHASNLYGVSSITYQLVVKLSRNNGVPPAPPAQLVVTSVTRSSVTLTWPPSRVDGGSPVTAYRLHYHRQFGDWDRVDVAVNTSTYSLLNLRCGTIYQFFMEAINEFGVGERTDTITISTQGTPPQAPRLTKTRGGLLSVNTTSIDLNLAAWGSGGCDISSFVIEYRELPTLQQPSSTSSSSKSSSSSSSGRNYEASSWVLVNNNVRLLDLTDSQQHYVVLDLRPRTHYVLRITAHNSAGSTVKEYQFTTLGHDGRKVPSEELLVNQETTLSSALPVLLFLLPIVILLLGLGFAACLQRGRIKQSLGKMAVKFSTVTNETNGPDLTDGLSMGVGANCNANEYEMSDAAAAAAVSDLNYGFGVHLDTSAAASTASVAAFYDPPSSAGILIANSAGASPALFSSRKLNDARYHYIVENPYSTIHWHHHNHGLRPSQYHDLRQQQQPRTLTRTMHDDLLRR